MVISLEGEGVFSWLTFGEQDVNFSAEKEAIF
jgi:hypothetical protein